MVKYFFFSILILSGCATTPVSGPKTYYGTDFSECDEYDTPTSFYRIELGANEFVEIRPDTENTASFTYCPNDRIGTCKNGKGDFHYISPDFIKIDLKVDGKRIWGTVKVAPGPPRQYECG